MTTKPISHKSPSELPSRSPGKSPGKPAKKPAGKSSYRSVQVALVVASFAASFVGAIWLQGQDASVATGTTTTTIVAEAQANGVPLVDEFALKAAGLELAPIPTVVPAAPVVRQPRAVARSRSSR